jgi:hypothetical protein
MIRSLMVCDDVFHDGGRDVEEVWAVEDFVAVRAGGQQVVARRCGFGDGERMRRAFLRVLGVPPSARRRAGG